MKQPDSVGTALSFTAVLFRQLDVYSVGTALSFTAVLFRQLDVVGTALTFTAVLFRQADVSRDCPKLYCCPF